MADKIITASWARCAEEQEPVGSPFIKSGLGIWGWSENAGSDGLGHIHVQKGTFYVKYIRTLAGTTNEELGPVSSSFLSKFCPTFSTYTSHLPTEGLPPPIKGGTTPGRVSLTNRHSSHRSIQISVLGKKVFIFSNTQSLVPFEVRGFLISGYWRQAFSILKALTHRSWIKERSESFKSCPNKCHQSCTPSYTQQILIIYSPDWFYVIVIIAIEQLTDLYLIYMYNDFVVGAISTAMNLCNFWTKILHGRLLICSVVIFVVVSGSPIHPLISPTSVWNKALCHNSRCGCGTFVEIFATYMPLPCL